MKHDVTESQILVAIPTELYGALCDSLPKRGKKRQPLAALVAVIRQQLADAGAKSSAATAAAGVERDWCDDWIAFQSPPTGS